MTIKPLCAASVALLSLLSPAMAQNGNNQNPPPLTHGELMTKLNDRRGAKPELVEKLRQWYGPQNLLNGPNPKQTDLQASWAVEIADLPAGTNPQVEVRAADGSYKLPLRRVPQSNIWAETTTVPEGIGFSWAYYVDGVKRGDFKQFEAYTAPPEVKEQAGVPKGKTTQMPAWESKIFGNTTRDWWVYVPAQYTPDKPACVMVFQDGGGVRNWVSTTFDNMIAKGEMPATIGIFVNPGRRKNQPADARPGNRSFEYDSLSDNYARFLLEEILPEVGKSYNLTKDPNGRAIAGSSSGAIAAFTVAWERPDEFRKVASFIGSYVNLQGGQTGIGGGHNYPTLIRKSKGSPKPIRVFLQDGKNDLDNPFGNWPLANQQMDKALTYSGYEHVFVYGNGFHNGKQMQALMPDALRYLWKDYKPAP